jgi:cytochrome c556
MTKKIIPFALVLSLGAFANNAADADNIQQAVIELLEKNVAKEEAKQSKIVDGLNKARAMYEAVKSAFATLSPTAAEAPAHVAEEDMPAQQAQPELTNKDL